MMGEAFDRSALEALEDLDDREAEREESELFARRREVLRPPLALEARVLAAVADASEARSARRTRLGSATRVALALAACIAAVAGDPAGLRGVGGGGRSDATSLDSRSASVDEPLACALPVSGFVRASDRVAACGMPSPDMDRARPRSSAFHPQLCEEVTFSSATP